jgi:hypothetical protein
MNEAAQVAFSVKSVMFAIEAARKAGKTHFFYSTVVEGDTLIGPGVLRKHLLDVVIALQKVYRNLLVVSRTPGGIVVHPCESTCFTNG